MAEFNFSFDTRVLSGRLDRTKEQIIPGHDSRYWLEFHLAFYRYANARARDKDALDIGCGYGYGSHLLSEHARLVTGIDYHPPAIAYAREHYQSPNLTFLRHDANTPLPFPDRSFDLIVSSEVLEHIEKQEDLIREVARVGRPGGHAIIKTPHVVLDPHNTNPHHHHTFTLEEYRNLMISVFPKAEIFLWRQRVEIKNRVVEFPLPYSIDRFGDANPSDKAILLYAETKPEILEPGSESDPRADLLAVCPMEG